MGARFVVPFPPDDTEVDRDTFPSAAEFPFTVFFVLVEPLAGALFGFGGDITGAGALDAISPNFLSSLLRRPMTSCS